MKKRLKYSILWLTVLLILPSILLACQCSKTSNKFTSRIHKAQFVGYVEIVGFDTIKDHEFDRTFTLVKVLEQLQGESVGKVIPILDGAENMECQRSFDYFKIGQRFIIKAHFENRKDHEFDFEDTPLPNLKINGPQVLALSICSENVIVVMGEMANGKITKPREQTMSLNQALSAIRKRTRFS